MSGRSKAPLARFLHSTPLRFNVETKRMAITLCSSQCRKLCKNKPKTWNTFTARKPETTDDNIYLHRGIATRAFDRKFHLADHVRATAASHSDGMLHIDLVRELPEALKPRRIEINSKDSLQVGKAPN